jgi:hypothetical protein
MLLLIVAASTLGVGVVRGQAPSQFAVTPQVGPWMICVASYRGEEARANAEEMCRELRTRYKVPAYLFNRADEERRKEAERVADIREQHKARLREAGLPEDTRLPVRTIRIEDQYAVLVGGFKDDVAARKYLDDIRKLKPSEKLQLTAYVPDGQGKLRPQAVNPFQSAFVCRNPMVPAEKADANAGPDPRLKEYNAGESFSLLKCPKPWTLVVKSYQGAAVIQSQSASKSVMERMLPFARSGALLNANAKQAHEVAEFLKRFGFEPYVLHTEFSSYVTIGSFDGPDDPRLVQMQQAFVNELNNPKSNVGQLHVIGGVQFMLQPMPMAVPQFK